MSKHTPGPWTTWGKADPSQIIASKDGFVAQTVGGNDEANARLIAAAPELLEALEVAEKALTTIFKAFNLGVLENADQMNIIRAAISKATGETK